MQPTVPTYSSIIWWAISLGRRLGIFPLNQDNVDLVKMNHHHHYYRYIIDLLSGQSKAKIIDFQNDLSLFSVMEDPCMRIVFATLPRWLTDSMTLRSSGMESVRFRLFRNYSFYLFLFLKGIGKDFHSFDQIIYNYYTCSLLACFWGIYPSLRGAGAHQYINDNNNNNLQLSPESPCGLASRNRILYILNHHSSI